MNQYEFAQLRLFLNRKGLRHWTIVPSTSPREWHRIVDPDGAVKIQFRLRQSRPPFRDVWGAHRGERAVRPPDAGLNYQRDLIDAIRQALESD